jgi:hypothetical protein
MKEILEELSADRCLCEGAGTKGYSSAARGYLKDPSSAALAESQVCRKCRSGAKASLILLPALALSKTGRQQEKTVKTVSSPHRCSGLCIIQTP